MGGSSISAGGNFQWLGSNLGGPDKISEILSFSFEQILRTVFSKVLFQFISLLKEKEISGKHDLNLCGQSGPVECKTRWPRGEIMWPQVDGPVLTAYLKLSFFCTFSNF